MWQRGEVKGAENGRWTPEVLSGAAGLCGGDVVMDFVGVGNRRNQQRCSGPAPFSQCKYNRGFTFVNPSVQ